MEHSQVIGGLTSEKTIAIFAPQSLETLRSLHSSAKCGKIPATQPQLAISRPPIISQLPPSQLPPKNDGGQVKTLTRYSKMATTYIDSAAATLLERPQMLAALCHFPIRYPLQTTFLRDGTIKHSRAHVLVHTSSVCFDNQAGDPLFSDQYHHTGTESTAVQGST